jgi:hypothetical protein
LYFVHFAVYPKIEKYFLFMERFMAWWNPFDWRKSSQESSQDKEMPRTAPPQNNTFQNPPEKPLLSDKKHREHPVPLHQLLRNF